MTYEGSLRTTTVLTLVVLGAVLLTGCRGEPEPEDTAKTGKQPPKLNVLIGVVLPLSGEQKSDGEAVLAGLQLALRERGDAIGLDASALKVEDYGARPQDVVSIVAPLVEDDEVSMLVGPLDPGDVKACESIAAKKKVPLLTTSSAEMGLVPVGSTVWRLTCTEVQEGRAMAEFAAKKGYRTVGVVDDSDMPASVSRGSAFFARFEELMGTGTVNRVSYDRGVVDFRRTVNMVAHDTRTRPAAFYLTGRRLESVAVLRKMKEMNVTGAVMGSSDWQAPADFPLEAAPGAAVFAPCRFYAAREDITTRTFVRTFRSVTGRDPGLLDALGYDAGLVLIDVLKRGGDKPGAALREIAKLQLAGVSGPLSPGAGTLAAELTVLRLVGTKFEFETALRVK